MAFWTPAEISTDLWLDASDADTITDDGGVSLWSDKSGNERNASQTNPIYMPAIIDGGMLMADTDHFLIPNTFDQPNIQIFMIAASTVAVTQRIIDAKDGSASTVEQGGFGYIISAVSSNGTSFTISDGTSYDRLNSGIDDVFRGTGNTSLVTIGYNGSTGVQDIRINGLEVNSLAAGANELVKSTSITNIMLGKGYQDDDGFTGTIYEVVILSSEMADIERQEIEGYLAHKWNINSLLPEGHLYEFAAPTIGYYDPALAPTENNLSFSLSSTPISTDQTDFPLTVVLDSTNPLHAPLLTEIAATPKKMSISIEGIQRPVEIESSEATRATLHTKVPTYLAATDTTGLLTWDFSQSDNTYVGETGEESVNCFPVTVTTYDPHVGQRTYRERISKESFAGNCEFVKLQMARPTAVNIAITECWVGTAADTGGDWDFDGNQQQVFFDGGNAGTTITVDGQLSDTVQLDLSGGSDVILSLYTSTGPTQYVSTPTGVLSAYFEGSVAGDTSAAFNPAGNWRVFSGILSVPIAQAVWDDNFEFVCHYSQDPSGTAPQILDSASHANHGTASGSMTSGDLIDNPYGGKAIAFDGVDDVITSGANIGISGASERTVEIQGDFADIANNQLLWWGADSTGNRFGMNITSTNSFSVVVSGGNRYWDDDVSGINYIAAVLPVGAADTSDLIGYSNGIIATVLSTSVGTINTTNSTFKTGEGSSLFGEYDGYEVRISSIARSAEWIKLTNLSLTDQLITWGGVAPTIKMLAYLNEEYGINASIAAFVNMIYGIKLGMIFNEYYGNAATVRKIFNEYYNDASSLRKVFDSKYGVTRELKSFVDELYKSNPDILSWVDQIYSISEKLLISKNDLVYALMENNLSSSWQDLIYAINADSVIESQQLEVYIDDTRVYPFHVNFEFNRGSFKAFAEIHLADQESYLLAIENQSTLRIKDGLDDLYFQVEVPRELATPGETTYTIPAESKCRILERTEAITEEFPQAMASATVAELAGRYGISVSWEINDWLIKPETLYANDDTPYDLIKKVTDVVMAKIQSDTNGNIRIVRNMDVDTTLWDSAPPTYYMTDQRNFFQTSEDVQERTGYNKYRLSDYEEASYSSLLEYEDLSSTKKEIKGYKIPYSGKDLILGHSGGSWVSIENFGWTEESITETIEIIQGSGQVSNPIYSKDSHEYMEINLGSITYNEDGTITTEISEQSLVEITYTTRFWKWQATDSQIEDVQFWLEEEE